MTHPQVALGEIATLIRGITYKPSDVCEAITQSAVACMRTKNVQEVLDESDIVWIPASLIRNSSKYLNTGDILVSSANSWNLVGKGCWVPELKYPASAGGFISILRGNPDAVDLRYLYHWFVSPQTQTKLRSYSNKTTNISNLDHSRTLATEIPLPPLEEQRRIAAILDKASSLSSRLECAVQIEDEFNASLFDKLVGDPVVNAKDFPRVRLADLCASSDDIKCGPFGTQLKQHEFRLTGVPLWGIKHVNRRFEIATSEFLEEDTATRLSAYSLEPGDIVMTRKGTVGNCSVYPDRFPSGVMHSDLLRIRLDETRCLPSFAAYQLHHSTDIKRQIDLISGGAIMAGINVGRLKEVKIVLPSLDIQKEFESLASRGSWLVWQKNQGMIRRSRELLQSLSSSFFLGSQSGQIKT
jgi:type I restriction enzyme S subunit